MQKPKLVIFDWDDTLAKTRDAVVKSMNYVLSLYKLPEWDVIKESKRDRSKSLKENFPNFFGKEEAGKAYEKYLEYYNKEGCKEVKKMENTDIFLKELIKNRVNIAIISNKEKSLLLNEVKFCFPDIKFDYIFGNGDTINNKPAPDPVIKMMENYNFKLNSDNVWFVGDTQQDTDCALSSGCQPILIGKRKFMNEDYLKINNSIKRFDNFEELNCFFKDEINKTNSYNI